MGKSVADSPETIQTLIDEMVKVKPDDERIKELMIALGLPCNDDPIDQMNVLLRALHGVPSDEFSM